MPAVLMTVPVSFSANRVECLQLKLVPNIRASLIEPSKYIRACIRGESQQVGGLGNPPKAGLDKYHFTQAMIVIKAPTQMSHEFNLFWVDSRYPTRKRKSGRTKVRMCQRRLDRMQLNLT